jgi:hypothetical protein
VTLEVFNVLGQRVAVLVDGEQIAGNHEVTWDGTMVSSGLYLYRLSTEGYSETRKMLLVK